MSIKTGALLAAVIALWSCHAGAEPLIRPALKNVDATIPFAVFRRISSVNPKAESVQINIEYQDHGLKHQSIEMSPKEARELAQKLERAAGRGK